ncbi:MAG: hypothetical protein ACRD04_00505, partial [Terriglobales bacterium]
MPIALVRSPAGVSTPFNARNLAGLMRATGADSIRLPAMANEGGAAALYRGGEPVAIIMPMRRDSVARLVVPQDAADTARLQKLGARARESEADARRAFASRHGPIARQPPHWQLEAKPFWHVVAPSADEQALADYARLGFAAPRSGSTDVKGRYTPPPEPPPTGEPADELPAAEEAPAGASGARAPRARYLASGDALGPGTNKIERQPSLPGHAALMGAGNGGAVLYLDDAGWDRIMPAAGEVLGERFGDDTGAVMLTQGDVRALARAGVVENRLALAARDGLVVVRHGHAWTPAARQEDVTHLWQARA